MKGIRRSAFLMACLIAAAAQAQQQTFPWKTIRLVSGVTPGSSSDTMARIVSEKLQAALGQPVIVENRLGAGGTIAADYVAKAEPDGHTISVYTSAFTVVPFTTSPPWDPIRDFTPVATLASTPNILVTSPSRGYETVQALVAAARANPGKLTFASAGLGSSTHMGGEKFRAAAGIDVVHVPYKGAPEAVADVIAGRVDYYFVPVVSALGQVRDGKLRALAVAAPKRIAALPDLPTTAEAGFPGAEYNFWVGMLVAAKTPRGTVERLNQEVNKVLQMADVRERTEKLGGEVLTMPLPAFEAMIREELAENEKLLKAAGVKRN
jgi:tripartite-type tricarboxylate transporter receptor subunit TctC